MADFGELETAEHLDGTFREAFPQWRDFRQTVADRARYPEFDEQRALQQVLMSDLAHRITADKDLGWLLIGSLALPARPAGNSWPADFGVPGVTDIPQQYLMPRSAPTSTCARARSPTRTRSVQPSCTGARSKARSAASRRPRLTPGRRTGSGWAAWSATPSTT